MPNAYTHQHTYIKQGLLRVGVGVVTTRQFQEESVRRALGLLAEHLNSYAYSAAFPELADPIAA
eukprot:1225613-Amorphochlora_amoeboformis.AAC.1